MEINKELITEFINFLLTEFKSDKHLKHVQFEKWSVNQFKISIKYYYHDQENYIFVDTRELKENQNHFIHLKGSIIDQLQKQLKLSTSI